MKPGERLKRIRNYQSKDFYPALVMRPLTIAILWVCADWKFLTPNRFTHLANLSKLGAAACLVYAEDFGFMVGAIALLNLGLLFDHLDGTLARYRRTWSGFGSYYDKVSDLITWFPITMALGWLAFEKTGEPLMLVLAAVHAYCLAVLGYAKWVTHAEAQRLDWLKARRDPEPLIEQHTRPPKLSEPPERSPRDWAIWLARSAAQIVRFEEMDLPLWITVFLLIDQLEILLWLLAVTHVFGMVVMVVKRGAEVVKIDQATAKERQVSNTSDAKSLD